VDTKPADGPQPDRGPTPFRARRQFYRDWRRKRVVELLSEYRPLDHGAKERIARELGVHRSVITRDVQFLLGEFRACPHCGALRVRLDEPLEEGYNAVGEIQEASA
jgi:hypothetical protein